MSTTTVLSTSTPHNILTAGYCTRKIRWIKNRLESSDLIRPTPYEKQMLELTKTFENPDTKSRVKMIFPGLPCHRCRQLILVGSEFYPSINRRTSKPYHLACAKEVHLI